MWFKNLYLFKFDEPFTLNAEQINDALASKIIMDCPSSARESVGWTSPFGRENEQMVLANQGHYLIRMARQERLLPASVIKEHLLERVEKIESRENRKVGGRERRELREELEFELLPKAFTKQTHIDAWIDSINNWLIINTSSAPRAESFAKLLRNTLGSLSIVLPETESSPMATMTQWLKKDKPPRPFDFGYECCFKSPDEENSTVTFKRHELIGDEVTTNLDAGKYVSQLELSWDDKIRFVLTENLIIKRLRFLDIMTDNLDKQGFESTEEKIDAEFALMVGEVTNLLGELMQEL